MSKCIHLALVLSLAACEHPPQTQVPAPVLEAPATAAPATTEAAHEAASPAAVEPATTEPALSLRPAPAKPALKKKCNPMSRAGCRWSEDRDERETSRVSKRAGDAGSKP